VSLFGLSYVGVYFKDDVDIYFARRLVGEKLQEAKERLPARLWRAGLGPNSSGLGQVFWYTVESADEKLSDHGPAHPARLERAPHAAHRAGGG
jgi:cobalt-zinc-cadmium resistance protein CzcA